MEFPHSGQDVIGVLGIRHHITDSCAIIHEQNLLECLASDRRAKYATLIRLTPCRPLHADKGYIRIIGMQNDPMDIAGVLQSQVHPGLTAID